MIALAWRWLRPRYVDRVRRLAGALPADFEARVTAEAESLYAANADRVVDRPSETLLSASCTILATYRVLLESVETGRAVEMVRRALVEPARRLGRPWLWYRMGISPLAPGRAFRRIASTFALRGGRSFGKGWRYEVERDDDEVHVTAVRKCLFAEFFRENGAPELMPSICALDDAWADLLNAHPDRYGVRFDRPTTLGRGDDACRFRFTRIAAG